MFATPVGNPTMNIRVAQIREALTKISIQKIFLSLPDAAFNIYIYVNIYMAYGIEVTHYTESAQLNRSTIKHKQMYSTLNNRKICQSQSFNSFMKYYET